MHTGHRPEIELHMLKLETNSNTGWHTDQWPNQNYWPIDPVASVRFVKKAVGGWAPKEGVVWGRCVPLLHRGRGLAEDCATSPENFWFFSFQNSAFWCIFVY